MSYDQKHWEDLIATIIDRIGLAKFIEMAAYVMEEKGYDSVADYVGRIQHLAAASEAKAVANGD